MDCIIKAIIVVCFWVKMYVGDIYAYNRFFINFCTFLFALHFSTFQMVYYIIIFFKRIISWYCSMKYIFNYYLCSESFLSEVCVFYRFEWSRPNTKGEWWWMCSDVFVVCKALDSIYLLKQRDFTD